MAGLSFKVSPSLETVPPPLVPMDSWIVFVKLMRREIKGWADYHLYVTPNLMRELSAFLNISPWEFDEGGRALYLFRDEEWTNNFKFVSRTAGLGPVTVIEQKHS